MQISGRIWREGAWWIAESEIADVVTQGKTRTEAAAMLSDAIESLANRDGFSVSVRDVAGTDGNVAIEASDPAFFTAFILRRMRVASGKSLAEVARELGQGSKNGYARYEQGRSTPTVDKLEELLRAVSPRAVVSVGLTPGRAKRSRGRAAGMRAVGRR